MELLTPDNLAEFVQAAQDFLSAAPVERYVNTNLYGYEYVTVQQGEVGEVQVANFYANGLSNSIAAYPEGSPHRTEYQLEASVGYILIHVYPQDEPRTVVAFVRRM